LHGRERTKLIVFFFFPSQKASVFGAIFRTRAESQREDERAREEEKEREGGAFSSFGEHLSLSTHERGTNQQGLPRRGRGRKEPPSHRIRVPLSREENMTRVAEDEEAKPCRHRRRSRESGVCDPCLGRARREERRRALRASVRKLRAIEDPESFLRRSVLVNNAMRRLQAEIKAERSPTSTANSKVAVAGEQSCDVNNSFFPSCGR